MAKKRMRSFGSELVGKNYTRHGRIFEVISVIPYPENEISNQYKEIMEFWPGVLVAVMFRGTLIPNITVRGGVVRLTGIKIAGREFTRPGEISRALRLKESMYAYKITEA